MKNFSMRLLSSILISTMVISFLTGCRRNVNNDNSLPEFVYVPKFITLPDEMQYIRGLVYKDELLYIASNEIIDNDSYNFTAKLYSINLDGSNLTELTDYSPKLPGAGNTANSVEIEVFITDPEGYFWVYETGSFTDNSGEFFNVNVLRKLNNTGAEISFIDLDSLFDSNNPQAWYYIVAFLVDEKGNIYLDVSVSGTRTIYVLNEDGILQFELELPPWESELFKMADGTIALFTYGEGHNRRLQVIEYDMETWGKTIDLPISADKIHLGGDSFDLVLSDTNNLVGIILETMKVVPLLNWIESDVMSDDLDNIVILPDDRIICTNQSFNFATREATNEIIIFTKTLITDLPGRILLTLAAFALDNRLKNAVIQFNRTNSEYRIQVVDYLDFRTDDDWFYGLTMLSLEIISGKIPDILVVQNLPFNHYIARGFIEDLYPFIDNDIEIDRNDFVEGVLRTSELDGKLYQIFPSFFINTILGHPSILGMGNGWNVDEFLAVLEANPQADVPMGEWLTKESFLMSTTLQSIDEYVDWVSGTVNFDSGAFAELLELADTFPAFIDWGDGLSYDMSEENIATGRQIMASALLSSFDSVKNYRNLFGGEIVYKGLPTENRNGNTMSVPLGIAMTTTCKDKDGAWEFMRTLLTKEWQLSNIFDFPVNKAAFNIKAENAMIVEETPDWWFSEWGVFPGLFPLTQNEFEQVIELVNSLSGIVYLDDALMDIVREGANDFFNGRYSTAQEAARVIQSRAAILVAEQMG